MINVWTDTAGNIHDQIGIVVADGPIHNGKDALGIVSGDTAFFDAGGETYEGNDGKIYDALPVFYPGTDTYEDSAGNVQSVVTVGSAPVVDFDGLTAGSVVGELGDTGSLPTGWEYAADGLTITVDEATHDAGGVECITLTFSIAEAGEAQIYFPDLQAAAEGQDWRASLYVANIENTDVEELSYGVAEFVDASQTDFNGEAVAAGLNEFDRTIAADVNGARGMISVGSGVPSSLTMTFAAKLEQIS